MYKTDPKNYKNCLECNEKKKHIKIQFVYGQGKTPKYLLFVPYM